MKKIGFVIPWFGEKIPGGAETALRELTTHLSAAGVPLEILTTCVDQFTSDWNKNYHRKGIDTVLGMTVRRFPVKKRNAPRFHSINYKLMHSIPVSLKEEKILMEEMINSTKLYQYMEKHQEEYSLFVFTPYMFGTTYYGCGICPEKSILIPCFHNESYVYMKLFQERFSSVRGMIFLAHPEYELAKRVYDLSGQSTAVFGCGLNTDLEGNGERFRESYNLRSPFILYAGRKDEGKNIFTLVKYFREYKMRHTNHLKLVLIGGGELEIPEEIRSDVLDLGFVPAQDKFDAYAAASLLCQPSKNESFSLVIMESWLCGRPVLVNEKCDVTTDFAKKAKGGLYFANYWDFQECINYILENPERAREMGRNGRAFVLENFTWDVIVERYSNYFAQVSGE